MELDLSNNKLKSIPEEISKFKKLVKVSLKGNPISSSPECSVKIWTPEEAISTISPGVSDINSGELALRFKYINKTSLFDIDNVLYLEDVPNLNLSTEDLVGELLVNKLKAYSSEVEPITIILHGNLRDTANPLLIDNGLIKAGKVNIIFVE